MSPNGFVVARGVGKTFRSGTVAVEAVKDVHMTVSKGDVVSVVGPSGCGKTTLLRMYAGLVQPSAGEVVINGIRPEENARKNGIGFVFQKPLLFPWRTVLQNVLLPSETRCRLDSDPALEASRLLEALGLEGFEDVHPAELSGGMLQRAALARALMTQPSILLLDEPFSALDEITREQIWTDFNGFWRDQGLTVVLVTHSIREAVFLSDRVLTMSKRPGTILGETQIPFAPEREHEITATAEFIRLCESIRKKLQ